jgi:hypothetical protein
MTEQEQLLEDYSSGRFTMKGVGHMETQLTKDIKRRLHHFRPAMNSSMRTIRWAEEVRTANGYVDVIRFEDYIANNKSYCSRENHSAQCKIPGNIFPCKECRGCVYHKHIYELGILATCFEVKITASDFNSKNGHNFSGNKNYYAVPFEIYESIKDDVPPGIGIIAYYQDSGHMIVKRESEMRQIAPEELNYLLYDALRKWVDEAPGHKQRCNAAERYPDGACRGYQRAEWDDEPVEMCKGCSHSEFYLDEQEEKEHADGGF